MIKKLILIFCAAFLVRVAYIAGVKPRPLTLDDAQQWNTTALYFLDSDKTIQKAAALDVKRPPVYPLFMATVYAAFGHENFNAVKYCQAFVDALSCVCIVYLAQQLALPVFCVNLTAALAIVYPPAIVYCEILQSECLFTFLFLLWFCLNVQLLKNFSWRRGLFSSAVLALLNLCRGTLLFFPFVYFVAVSLHRQQKKLRWQYAVLGAFSLALLLPWTWRNYKVYHSFIPSAGGSAEAFWVGTLAFAQQDDFSSTQDYRDLQVSNDLKTMDAVYKKAALDNIRQAPLVYVKNVVQRGLLFFTRPIGRELVYRRNVRLAYVVDALHWTLLILAVYGLICLGGYSAILSWAVLFYFTAVHMVTIALPRYRLPLEPLFLMWAVYGVWNVWNKWRKTQHA